MKYLIIYLKWFVCVCVCVLSSLVKKVYYIRLHLEKIELHRALFTLNSDNASNPILYNL